jgi:hypothetical protein
MIRILWRGHVLATSYISSLKIARMAGNEPVETLDKWKGVKKDRLR